MILIRALATMLVFLQDAHIDDQAWFRYRQAVEKINDFECEYRILTPPAPGLGIVAERGAIAAGDGMFVELKYAPFRWSRHRNRVYFDQSLFNGNYYPPHDWDRRIVFYDGDVSGLFTFYQRTGTIRIAPPVEVGYNPNPATFLKPKNWDLATIEASGNWKAVTGSDHRLELKVDFGGMDYRYEIELDPEHGFLPKSFKAIPLGAPQSYNEFLNEEFVEIDGIWFPVKSRLRYFGGTSWGSVLETERVVEVNTSTLRVNCGFEPKDFQFTFPDDIYLTNEITGEVLASDKAISFANAFLSVPVREPLPATPLPSSIRNAWIGWMWRTIMCVAGALALMVCVWHYRRLKTLFGFSVICVALPTLGGIGCNSPASGDGVKLGVSELTKITTVPTNTEGIVESLFVIENLGDNRIHVGSVRAGCSCASATFSKSDLRPSEKATLRVMTRYRTDQPEVGHDVVFTAQDISKQAENFRVKVLVARDSDWSVPFTPHLDLVQKQFYRSNINMRFSGDEPQDVSIHCADGIECTILGQSVVSDSTIRLDVELFANVAFPTKLVNFSLVSSNKSPMVLTKQFRIAVDTKFDFTSSSFTLKKDPIILGLEGTDVACQVALDSHPRGILSLEVDPARFGIIATRDTNTDYQGIVKVLVRMRIDDAVYLRECLVLVD